MEITISKKGTVDKEALKRSMRQKARIKKDDKIVLKNGNRNTNIREQK